MKRVLVTGGSGFIGRHSLAPLVRAGYEVFAVLPDWETAPELGATVKWRSADLLDKTRTERLLEEIRPSHLLHFAWNVEPGKYVSSPGNLLWTSCSLALLHCFAGCGGRRVVMAGTCAEYDWRRGFLSEHVTPCKPATLYGACKHALRVAGEAFAKEVGVSWAWGRIFFLYGPYEDPGRFVASVARSLLRGEPARCTHGGQVRDFLHVQDVATAFVALLDGDVQGAVNIASGQGVTLKEIALTIARRLRKERLLEFGALDPPANDPPRLVGDASRLRNEVRWSPAFSLDRGIAHAITWWESQDLSA